MMLELSAEKAKVAPLTKRYHNGSWHNVEQNDSVKRVAICDLNNRHSGDYKVAYVSDPLLVILSKQFDSHDELESVLRDKGLWLEGFNPIEIPHNEEWIVGFKSLPRSANMFNMVRSRLETLVDDEYDCMGNENSVAAYLPA